VADLAAVVSASGAPAFVYGHSSGGALVLRAAAVGVPFTAVASYWALTGDQGVPDSLASIAVPVLVLGGGTSPDWFHRTVQETADVIPGAKLVMIPGYDHGVPPEVIAPVLTEFFLGSAA
jgi:pimeloyl-ACP methyl ester carboxylesterase